MRSINSPDCISCNNGRSLCILASLIQYNNIISFNTLHTVLKMRSVAYIFCSQSGSRKAPIVLTSLFSQAYSNLAGASSLMHLFNLPFNVPVETRILLKKTMPYLTCTSRDNMFFGIALSIVIVSAQHAWDQLTCLARRGNVFLRGLTNAVNLPPAS